METPRWMFMLAFNLMAAYLPVSAVILFFRPASWPNLFALFTGLFLGILDLSATDVQGPALLLLTFSMFIAYASPRAAWRWGLLTGIWIPVFGAARWFAAGSPPLPGGHPWDASMALIFSFAGSYAGSLIHRYGREDRGREHIAASGSTTGTGDERRSP
ncbi:MAG TPA: hypothetical protein VL221_09925 [Bacteroidota bacterium]|nr:hypothetical protein [Bacteroidota bacterium]